MHNRLKGLPKSKSVDDEHDADQKLEALNKGRECAATHNSTKSFVSSLRSHGSVSFSTKSIPSSSNRSGASSMKERGRLAQTRFQDFEDMIARVARLQTSPTTVTNSEPAEVPTPINPDKLNSLHRAVWKANFRRFCTLLTERGRNLNKFDRHHGITALHLCAELPGRFDYAKALIACHNERAHNSKWQLFLKKPNVTDRSIRDIDLEAPNPSLRTALCLAVIYGNTPVAKLLLDHGALTNPQDVFGCTPLHYALLNNDVPMFDAILRFGGNVDTLDKTDSTLLHHSILLQNKEITKLIMTSGHNLCNILNRNQK
ncbi:ankyrin repeat-containing domain protein [Cladochytrium replicatum]|nr:ankyrin repeat-containing domain protein [Cladochytrium replicatum]